MKRAHALSLLLATSTLGCGAGVINGPSTPEANAELRNPVDPNNNGDNSCAVCSTTPYTVGSVNPNAVICGVHDVPIHMAGNLTPPVDITIQPLDGNGHKVTGVMQSMCTCEFAYVWRVSQNGATGQFAIAMNDANGQTLSFNVTVKERDCGGGDADGDQQEGDGDHKSNGDRKGHDDSGDKDGGNKGNKGGDGKGGDGKGGDGKGRTTCGTTTGGSTTGSTSTTGGTTTGSGTTTGAPNPNSVIIGPGAL